MVFQTGIWPFLRSASVPNRNVRIVKAPEDPSMLVIQLLCTTGTALSKQRKLQNQNVI
jgi:hypothetical protein